MKEMIAKKIKHILDDLDKNLNQDKISFSSENAFVFHFALGFQPCCCAIKIKVPAFTSPLLDLTT